MLLIASAASTLTAQTPTVTIDGDHFVVNGTPKFLIFLSYFDAMRASSGTLDSDFNFIANTLHLDGVRIFPNWWDYGCSGTANCFTQSTLMSVASPRPDGKLLRSGAMTQLRLVLDKAKQYGLVVDMSFARDTVCDTTPAAGTPCPNPLGVADYKQQIKDALEELMNDLTSSVRFNHVIVDLQNEHDDGGSVQQLADGDVQGLVTWINNTAAAHPTWRKFPVTASTTIATGAQGTANATVTNGLNIAAYHDPRGGSWSSNTAGVVDSLRNSGENPPRPAYLQEPMPFGNDPNREDDYTPANFTNAVSYAVQRGAAAWTFHTRSAFKLLNTSYQTVADALEENTAAGLRTAADNQCVSSVSSTSVGAPVNGSTPSVGVTIPQLCGWTASSQANWITVNQTWGRGNGQVTLTIAANGTGATRTGTVTIAGKTVTVTQTACGTPSVSPTTLAVWPSLKSYTVTVTAAAGCTWNASTDKPWLTITSGASGSGTSAVTVSVAANYSHATVARSGHLLVNGSVATITQPAVAATTDYDGNGRSDLVVIRPSTTEWQVAYNGGIGGTMTRPGILANDIPVSGDFDGDARTDLAVWRPGSGTWYIITSGTAFDFNQQTSFQWGQSGDIPMPGDFDGDGKTDGAVYRPSNGTWYLRYSSGGTASYGGGLPGDVPRVVDFDRDGKGDLVFWRPSSGTWYTLTSSTGYNFNQQLQPVGGGAGDIPIPADFDGDGYTDLCVYRPSNGTFSIWTFPTGIVSNYAVGVANDVPRVADFDGDGKADFAVWRPSNGVWYMFTSSTNYAFNQQSQYTWGQLGDLPLSEQVPETPCTIGVSTSAFTTWPSKSTATFNVIAAPGCLWSVTPDTPWLTVTGNASGSGNATVTVQAANSLAAANRVGHLNVTGHTVTVTQPPHAVALDYDGDRLADRGVARTSTTQWYIATSGGAQFSRLGPLAGDVQITGDFDGDRKTDFGVFRPGSGYWYILTSSTTWDFNQQFQVQYGSPGDIPMPADFDGDGITDIAVYRPSNGSWHVRWSSGATPTLFSGGLAGDIPVAADFDADGKADLVFYRPSGGIWFVLTSSTGYAFNQQLQYTWGASTDLPMAADYDHDGIADLTTYTPATSTTYGTFHVRFSSNGTTANYPWGLVGDVPLAGDFDGDGKTDIVLWRPSGGYWFVVTSSSNFDFYQQLQSQWGQGGDIPLPPSIF